MTAEQHLLTIGAHFTLGNCAFVAHLWRETHRVVYGDTGKSCLSSLPSLLLRQQIGSFPLSIWERGVRGAPIFHFCVFLFCAKLREAVKKSFLKVSLSGGHLVYVSLPHLASPDARCRKRKKKQAFSP